MATKKIVFLFALLFLFVYGAENVNASPLIDCSFQSVCPNTSLFYVKNSSSGYLDSHAQLASNGTYPYSMCCYSSFFALSNSCGTYILNLSANSNSHVQTPTSSAFHYLNAACLSLGNSLVAVNYAAGSCASGSGVFSISNDTNAHVGNFNEYNLKACITTSLTAKISTNAPNTTKDRLNLSVNFTLSNVGSLVNCSLDFNTTGQVQRANTTMVNLGNGTYNVTGLYMGDGAYSYRINCSGDLTTQNFTYEIDATNPILSMFNPPKSKSIMGTDSNLSLNLLATDDHLFACLVNVSNTSNGNVKYVNLTTGIASSAFIQNASIYLNSSDVQSNFTVNWTCADSHTAKNIPDWDISFDLLNRAIVYKTPAGNTIKLGIIMVPNLLSLTGFSTYKNYDRYTYSINYNNTKNNVFVFSLETDNSLFYVGDDYPGHFVVLHNNSVNGEWIDFNLVKGTLGNNYNISVIQVYNNKYQITLTTSLSNLTFRSLGGLNEVSAYGWYYFNNQTPTLKFIDMTDSDGSVDNRNLINVNVTSTEPNPIEYVVNFNGSNYSDVKIGTDKASTNFFYRVFRDLPEGNYSFYAFMRNSLNLTGQTATRTVYLKPNYSWMLAIILSEIITISLLFGVLFLIDQANYFYQAIKMLIISSGLFLAQQTIQTSISLASIASGNSQISSLSSTFMIAVSSITFTIAAFIIIYFLLHTIKNTFFTKWKHSK